MTTRHLPLPVLAGVLALAWPLLSPAADPLKQKVNLLDSIKSGKVTYHINEKQTIHDPPDKIWSFMDNGQLKVSGMGFGYVRTNDVYRDYHLVIEYKFTGPTLGTRTGKARDNGLFVHCHGPDGAYGGTWMAGIEAQIIEGGVGDILILSPKLQDGTELITSIESEYEERGKAKVWKRGAPRRIVTKGRIDWEKRDPEWKDEVGFRGKDDVESRLNEWTRMEVIAKGDTLQYFVNGVLVNECFACKPSEGYVFLQTEGAEMIVKRYELYPLGEFKEKWNPVSASGGSEVPVKLSREAAIPAEESRKLIELDGPFEAQLVAAEPLVRDPVEITWDAQGRCYVADMIDYPLGPGPGLPPLSRIQQLIDDNKDGRYDRAVTFADKMDHVQGLLPYKDGLIATTRTQILFVRDTNGDGVADERKPLVAGFNPNHSQLQVSAPRWGLDNCVHFNNGLDTKEIYPAETAGKKQNFARCNLRWDPATGKLEPSTGFGQFGGCFDDWGRHFFCSNRNPVMFAVLPYEAVIRNPNAGITQGWEDIAPFGAESKIHPLAITHTTADAHAGTHTAACGLGVYRGDLTPELRGEIFVCEPTAQAVVRYHSQPNGASLKAARVGDHTEFFRSRDEWTRPVNVATGPDGALYVCDMYRQYIDHARFFPESFSTTHDMRKGENEGRIWRIVPRGTTVAKPQRPAGRILLECGPGQDDLVLDGKGTTKAGLQKELEALSKRLVKEGLIVLGDRNMPAASIQSLMSLIAAAGVDNITFSAKSEDASSVPVPAVDSDRMPAPRTVEGLVKWLGHKNSWQRETAQRLLVEKNPPGLVGALKAALATDPSALRTLHTTSVMGGLHLKDADVVQAKIDGAEKSRSGRGPKAGSNIQDSMNLLQALAALDLRFNPQVDEVSIRVNALSPDARAAMLGIVRAGGVASDTAIMAMLEAVWKHPDDVWIHRAVASSSQGRAGKVLARVLLEPVWGSAPNGPRSGWLLSDKPALKGYTPNKVEFVRALASCSAADASEEDFRAVLSTLSHEKGRLTWWKPALLQGISDGLPKSGGKLGVKTLAEFTGKAPEAYKDAAAEITALLAQVDKVMTDSAAPMEQRLACLPLIAPRGWEKAEPVMRTLLADGQPLEISNAAIAQLKKFPADRTAPLLYELLPKLGPAPRAEVVKMLTGNSKTVKDFFERIDRGEVPKAFVDAETRWRYLRPNNPLHALAEKIFGKPSTDRAAVITNYTQALKLKGDSAKGHQIFSAVCIACHRLKGEGVDVAPDITDVKIKEKEALLSDILDPNRMVEARWMAYQIDTKDGRMVSGIVSAETSSEVTIKMAGGITEAIPRANIAKMKSLDASLMPVGLEAGISKEQMADLLAYLKGE